MQIELVVINGLELDTHERMRQHLALACVVALSANKSDMAVEQKREENIISDRADVLRPTFFPKQKGYERSYAKGQNLWDVRVVLLVCQRRNISVKASFMQTTLRACVRFNKRRAKSSEEKKKRKEKRKIPMEILVHLKHNSDFINQVPSLGICESYNENAIKGFIRSREFDRKKKSLKCKSDVTYIESIEFHVKKKEHQKRRRTRTNESATRFYLVFVRTDTVWRDNQYPRWYNCDVVRSYGKEHKDYTILAIGSTGASYFVYPTVRLEIG
ncbi:hypothetical protein V1478_017847 [Vespula squamosa]|uniref:Uncharacterized protein n=1 Tax=Vespula squamosa TaxID=30214 RepID=A0ABD1ZVC6_VESSQ